MRRRAFLAAFAGALTAAARSQAAQGRVPHLAFFWLGAAGSDHDTLKGFQAGLRDYGYTGGRNIIVDYLYADGNMTRLADLAAAAVAAQPDVIVAFGAPIVVAVAKLTRTIPIVSLASDQARMGYARSLARPGGNVTGLALDAGPFVEKWLQMLAEAMPKARRIAMLTFAPSPPGKVHLDQIRAAADRLGNGFTIEDYAVGGGSELASTLVRVRQARPDALIVDDNPLFEAKAAQIVAAGVPVIGGVEALARAGGLISYHPSIFDLARRTGSYIDRILKGAKPADLPIEQPTKFELVINLKTATAPGLTVPPLLLAQADVVIQ